MLVMGFVKMLGSLDKLLNWKFNDVQSGIAIAA